jgi:hypothetical protein
MTRRSRTAPSGSAQSAFWTSLSLDQLVPQQGIRPITDIAELNAMFPAGDVFDDVLSDLLQDRAERRHDIRAKRSAE